MRRASRARRPEAALARLLSVLARQNQAVAIGGDGIDMRRHGGAVPPGVITIAEGAGLVSAEAGKYRILPAGVAWLRRRLSGGDGFQDQHRLLGSREIKIDGVRHQLTVNHLESPLAWLRHRKDGQGRAIISEPQFEAGERLRADFEHGGLSPRVTASWDGLSATERSRRGAPGDATSIRDNITIARLRFRHAIDAVGPELAGILMDVCCHLVGLEEFEQKRGWPARSAKLVLSMALTSLARHYGLIAPEPQAGEARPEITHWAETGYRPTLEGWEEVGQASSGE